MIKKIALAFCALLLLAGCSSSAKKGVASGSMNPLAAEFEREAGDRVFFAYDSSDLSSEAQQTLMRQAKWLKDRANVNMAIEGHCDERGTREYNIALGERRAHTVKKFLVKQGIDEKRMETISYGKERPAVIGEDEAAWSKNRRGVIVLK